MEKFLSNLLRLLRSKKLLQAEIVLLAVLTVITVSVLVITNLPFVAVAEQKTPIAVAKPAVVTPKPENKRVTILRAYLEKKGSPLVPYAGDFVEAADTYGVDWRLVAAISGVESSFGRFIPGGWNESTISYNGWGWGVYGTQSMGFRSWKDGIYTVTEGLSKNYIKKGLTTPIAMNHVYAASPTWGVRVNYFMDDMAKFEKDYTENSVVVVNTQAFETNIAGASGELLADAH